MSLGSPSLIMDMYTRGSGCSHGHCKMLQIDDNGDIFSQRHRGWIPRSRVLEWSGCDEDSLCG